MFRHGQLRFLAILGTALLWVLLAGTNCWARVCGKCGHHGDKCVCYPRCMYWGYYPTCWRQIHWPQCPTTISHVMPCDYGLSPCHGEPITTPAAQTHEDVSAPEAPEPSAQGARTHRRSHSGSSSVTLKRRTGATLNRPLLADRLSAFGSERYTKPIKNHVAASAVSRSATGLVGQPTPAPRLAERLGTTQKAAVSPADAPMGTMTGATKLARASNSGRLKAEPAIASKTDFAAQGQKTDPVAMGSDQRLAEAANSTRAAEATHEPPAVNGAAEPPSASAKEPQQAEPSRLQENGIPPRSNPLRSAGSAQPQTLGPGRTNPLRSDPLPKAVEGGKAASPLRSQAAANVPLPAASREAS